jgi:DNA-binding Lrp family transcriptional regulator
MLNNSIPIFIKKNGGGTLRFATKKDLLLMSYFRQNARENLTKISRITSIPVSTIFDKLKEFEKTVIQRHTTLVDFKKLGFDIRVNILFKVSRPNRDQFREFLLKNENINSVYKVNNGYDFLTEGIFKDMGAMHKFMENLDRFEIEAKQEMFVLEDVKREGFLADKMQAELLFADN